MPMEWSILVPLNKESEILEIDPDRSFEEPICPVGKSVVRVGRSRSGLPYDAWTESEQGEPVTLADPEGLFDPTNAARFDVVIWNGSSLGTDSLSTGARSWPDLEQAAAAVRPGGYLYFRMANSFWGSWNPLARMVLWIGRGPRSDRSPLVDLGDEAHRFPRGSRRACQRRLQARGFSEVQFFHSFPNHRRLHFAVPLDHPGVVDYFLTHMLPRRTRVKAAAIGAARLANRFGLYGRLCPVFSVLARKGDRRNAPRDS